MLHLLSSLHLLPWSEFLRRLTTPVTDASLAVMRVNTSMEKYVNGYQSSFVEKQPRLKCECALLKQRGHAFESKLCAVLRLTSYLLLASVRDRVHV